MGWAVRSRQLLARRQQRGTLRGTAGHALFMGLEALAIRGRRWRPCGCGLGGQIDHADAIHRTRCNAQLAAGTQLGHDGVQETRRADDGIHGTGRQAFGATDAGLLVDHRDPRRRFHAVVRIQRQHRASQQLRERLDGRSAARRALVDGRVTLRDGAGVGQASLVAATRALRLRQQGVDGLHVHVRGLQVMRMPGVAPESGDSRNRPAPAPLAASTIPSETPKRILRGARFATTTVRRPVSAAGS